MRILVVDDTMESRELLNRHLRRWGHEVVMANDGLEALDILRTDPIPMVITDWMMPRMDGLELCRQIRSGSYPSYIYIIVVTAKDSKGELVTAMEEGADDYLAKPFDKNELKVRVGAGERILKLEQSLEQRNASLDRAYSIIRKDLESAARLQRELLPQCGQCNANFSFEWLFIPCSFVAGDTLHYLDLDENHVGFFLLDVAGHGVPAAMLSFTLMKTLSSLSFSGNPLVTYDPEKRAQRAREPSKVMEELNRSFQADDETMQYFTMIYGIGNARDGSVRLSQAGHPPAILMPSNGPLTLVGQGGFPIGLYPKADYDQIELGFHTGDRLFLFSDGITECADRLGEEYSMRRLLNCLEENRKLTLRELLEKVEKSLRDWRGDGEFDDDITLLAMEKLSP